VAVLVKFWGTRGSLPAPLNESAIRTKIRQALIIARGRQFASVGDIDAFIDKELLFSVRGTFGGNSSCVEIATRSEDYFLCDLGTGLREFSGRVMADHKSASRSRFNIFLSHLHWDHIQGFPFFAPAHTPGAVIRIYGCHGSMRKALRSQQSAPYFPVKFEELKASIDFIELQPGRTYDISGISVTPMLQCHAGDSYGYRFAYDGKTVVYSTDNEHSLEAPSETARLVEFYRDADLLISDTMYSLADAISQKAGWGHSSNMVAVELAHLSQVKHLVLFHHEPAVDDTMLEAMLDETRCYEEIDRGAQRLKVTAAYDGLEVVV
jgi:phosphoribosyl 1,2-cyclic phosphodiesterase